MSGDFVVFGRPDLQESDIAEVVDTLRSGWIGTGPKAAQLEKQFSAYVDAPYGVATNSCTAALHLALMVLGIGPGDEVIVPTMTFPATANVVVHVGASPVFADVSRNSRNMSAEDLAGALSERTAAIIPVHFAGYPVDVDALRAAIGDRPVAILADAAHAIETQHRGRSVGALTEFAAFSFYATKNLTTAEGGMLTSHDVNFADRVRRLGLHGLSADAWERYSDEVPKLYGTMEPGYKYNLSDLQAALALHQLLRIERSLERRADVWERYDEAFSDLPLELPPRPLTDEGRSALHLYSPLLSRDVVPFDRDEFRMKLHAQGIGTGVHFVAVHQHPYYQERFGLRRGTFPAAEHISDCTVSLPMGAGLREDEVERVIFGVRNILDPYV